MVRKKMDYKVCVVGLGFVGLTLAMMISQRGLRVVGIDTNEPMIDELLLGNTTICDPGIEELLKSAVKEGRFTPYYRDLKSRTKTEDISSCNVFIITVGTPLRLGKPNLDYFRDAVGEIAGHLSKDDLVIVRSTVSIGSTRKVFTDMLGESVSDVFLAMCPERTIEGNALVELKSLPQIVGGLTMQATSEVVTFFESIGVECVIVDSLEGAELAKLVNNTYRDLMFAFANEVAQLANKVGVSAGQVIRAANYNYPRSNIAMPGPSGGPCLEKDPWILFHSGESYGVEMKISKAARQVNEYSVTAFVKEVLAHAPLAEKVAILGLSFKSQPETLDLRGTLAYTLCTTVTDVLPHASIVGFEPSGWTGIEYLSLREVLSLDEAVTDADIIIIANRHPSFKDFGYKIVSDRKVLVIDLWGQFQSRNPLVSIKSWV
jgi:UDP-N-acetyl-D-mannosaminuronic acid dehydrogenase